MYYPSPPSGEHPGCRGGLCAFTFTLPLLHKEGLSTLSTLEAYEPGPAVALAVWGGAAGAGGANGITVTGWGGGEGEGSVSINYTRVC